MKELLKKLRKFEITIRKAINSRMQGDFHSVFKGSGLEFDDVRPYQYGDDIRTIDWKVSAKGHGTFVKTYREEKEQTVYFLVDLSESGNIGDPGRSKREVAIEICGVLTLSAIRESSHVGLIAFTDQREISIKPAKGDAQAYQIIQALIKHQPRSTKTNLQNFISFALNTIRRRSVVILLSDFIDEGYEDYLKSLARSHDLVVIHLSDKRESGLPALGIVPVLDKESGKTLWINSSFGKFANSFRHRHEIRMEQLMRFSRKHQINYIHLHTQEDYVPKLLRLFKVRNKTKKTT